MSRAPHAVIASAVALALAAGCAHRPPLLCPAHDGGHEWVELTSKHFITRTDWEAAEARKLVARLEQTYATWIEVAQRLLPSRPTLRERILVSLFRRSVDYKALGLRNSDGQFRGVNGEPLILATADGEWSTYHLMQHELAHAFIWHYLGAVPRWLNEGLAEYAATFFILRGRGVFGAAPDKWAFFAGGPDGYRPFAAPIDVDRLPTIGKLMRAAAEFRGNDHTLYYAIAWGVAHWLITMHAELLLRFAAARADGASPGEALAVLQPLGLERLDAQLRKYVTRGRVVPRFVPSVSADSPIVERAMTDEDVHLWWAQLAAGRDDALAAHHLQRVRPDRPERLLDEALKALRAKDDAHALELAEAALARDTSLFRARYLVALIHFTEAMKRPEQERHLEALDAEYEALERGADSPDAWNLVAWFWAQRKEPTRGLPLAKRAVQECPRCWHWLNTLALLLFESGARDEAIATQVRAVSCMRGDGANAPELLAHLEQFLAPPSP